MWRKTRRACLRADTHRQAANANPRMDSIYGLLRNVNPPWPEVKGGIPFAQGAKTESGWIPADVSSMVSAIYRAR